MENITVLYDRGIYDIDIVNELGVSNGTLTVDTNSLGRQPKYYVVDSSVMSDSDNSHEARLVRRIVDEISERKNKGELVGTMKDDAEMLLLELLYRNNIYPKGETELLDRDMEFAQKLEDYHSEVISEYSMNSYCMNMR